MDNNMQPKTIPTTNKLNRDNTTSVIDKGFGGSDGVHLQSSQPTSAPVTSVPRTSPSLPPPLPPRPAGVGGLNLGYRAVPPYTGGLTYNTPFSRPFGSSYMPYGGYGSRFGYPHGQGYHSWSDVGDAETAFIRMAEESSRPAFQSIESLVNAVGSISMMLESTYHAVYNSYRAVLGVVENFSRLRNHFAHILSTLALIRTLQWLLHRILYFLRLRKTHPSAEAAWTAAKSAAIKPLAKDDPHHSIWPIVAFLGIVFGAPWLLFRIFAKVALKRQHTSGENEVVYAVALYDFRATQPGELSIRAGQQLTLAPRNLQPKLKGWVLAHADSPVCGLVPSNYIRMYRKKIKTTKPAAASQVVPEEEATAPKTVAESNNVTDAAVDIEQEAQ